MAEFTINKSSFDMQKLGAELEKSCKEHNISDADFSKILLVTEEYLTNILFPNFDGSAEMDILRSDSGLVLSFRHQGADFLNKITDASFLSLKIIENKTKDMKSYTKEGVTSAEFVF